MREAEVGAMARTGKLKPGREMQGTLTKRSVGEWFTQLLILFRIQFSIIREAWAWIFIMAAIFPLTTMFFLRFFTPQADAGTVIRIITGNMVFAIALMGVNALAQELSWQKHQGHFVFYASLPVSKFSFVAAIMLRGIITTLPSVIILCIIGQAAFHVDLNFSWGLIPLGLISMTSSVGFGALLGFWSPNHQFTNMLAQGLLMFISFLTPVMVEAHQLPVVLQLLSRLFPTTYVAEALRTVLLVGWTAKVSQNAVILAGFSLASILLIHKKVYWRLET